MAGYSGAFKELHGREAGIDIASGRMVQLLKSTDARYPVPMVIAGLVAAGTALTNSTTETALGSVTIPANSLVPGSVIRIKYQMIATATNSTDTLAVKLYIGATGIGDTALISHAATDVADNNVVSGEYELVIRTAGSSGTMVGMGLYKSVPAAEGTITVKDDILASTTIDTTVDTKIVLAGTWSVASASNSCRADILNVWLA